jgi:hypothetical protein
MWLPHFLALSFIYGIIIPELVDNKCINSKRGNRTAHLPISCCTMLSASRHGSAVQGPCSSSTDRSRGPASAAASPPWTSPPGVWRSKRRRASCRRGRPRRHGAAPGCRPRSPPSPLDPTSWRGGGRPGLRFSRRCAQERAPIRVRPDWWSLCWIGRPSIAGVTESAPAAGGGVGGRPPWGDERDQRRELNGGGNRCGSRLLYTRRVV